MMADTGRLEKTGRVATDGGRMAKKKGRMMTFVGLCGDPQYIITTYNKEYRKVGVYGKGKQE